LARAIISAMMFLELADEETLDLDAAVQAMEMVGAELQQCTSDEVAALQGTLKQMIKREKSRLARPEVLEFLGEFMDSLGLPDDEE
jgi:hypothetical protein